MPDTLITNLTDSGALDGTEEVPGNRAGTDVKITTARIAALASGGGLPLQLPIQDGRYYSSPFFGSRVITALAGDFAETMLAIPFIAHHGVTWTEIGVECMSSDAGDAARLGIYSDTDGLPDALVVDAGEISFASTGELPKTISEALTAGTWYWLVIGFNSNAGAAEIRAADSPSELPFGNFVCGSTGTNANRPGYSKAFTYGALPASFGEPDGTIDTVPYIWLRTGV
jgi:hypothetical protein